MTRTWTAVLLFLILSCSGWRGTRKGLDCQPDLFPDFSTTSARGYIQNSPTFNDLEDSNIIAIAEGIMTGKNVLTIARMKAAKFVSAIVLCD